MKRDTTPSINNDDLDYDQTYLRNKRLPRPDAQFNWTPEMVAEIKKCTNDIHYFAENYFHIVTSDDGKQKIDLYPAQKRALKALQKYRYNIINASRQSGKTTLMTIYALWMTCFEEYKRVVIVANKENTAIMILRRVALAYEELPNWLKPGTAQYGKKEIIFGNHSSIGISTTTGSAVRGDTLNCIDGETIVTIRNKHTHQIYDISMKDLTQIIAKDGEIIDGEIVE
jgi:hypothetical protein